MQAGLGVSIYHMVIKQIIKQTIFWGNFKSFARHGFIKYMRIMERDQEGRREDGRNGTCREQGAQTRGLGWAGTFALSKS